MSFEIDTAPCLYFACDDQGFILSVNQMVTAMLGYERQELLGAHINTIFPVSARIFYNTHAFPLLKVNKTISEIFLFLRTSSGEQLPMLVNAARVEGATAINKFVAMKVESRNRYESQLIAARNEAQAMATQNSTLKTIQEDLRKRSIELDEALSVLKKQHEDLRQLNKIVTHDLQEPIRKLFFYNALVKEKAPDGEITVMLDKVNQSSLRLKEVIGALQSYIWLDDKPLEIVPINLFDLICKIKTDLSTVFSENNIEWQVKPLPICVGDEDLVYAMFFHLLKNALQYSDQIRRNKINVSSTLVTENVFRNIDGHYAFANFFRITIEDSGVGFPVDEQEVNAGIQLFRKWNQAGGVGLGLALSQKIATLHGGWLKASNGSAGGARIDIYWKEVSL